MDPKFILTQKFFGPNIFWGLKPFLEPKTWTEIFFEPKNFFGPKIFFEPKNFFWTQKLFFDPKFSFGPNFFRTQKDLSLVLCYKSAKPRSFEPTSQKLPGTVRGQDQDMVDPPRPGTTN